MTSTLGRRELNLFHLKTSGYNMCRGHIPIRTYSKIGPRVLKSQAWPAIFKNTKERLKNTKEKSVCVHFQMVYNHLWSLWRLWQNCHNGHNRDMAIVAIDAIVDPRPSILVSKEAFQPQEYRSKVA